MRIVTWNCNTSAQITVPHSANVAFAQKLSNLNELEPDVAILQEVAQPEISSTANTQWYGATLGRGIAVVTAHGYTVEAAPILGTSYSALPVHVRGPLRFNVLAIWSRPQQSSLKQYVAEVYDVIEMYRDFLVDGPSIVTGDFNSNAFWNKQVGKRNHSALVSMLANDFGLVSSYHTHYNYVQGHEQHPTFYQYRHEDKPFHIDYCFVPKTWMIESVRIGTYADWNKRSDHCPLIVDIAV